MTVDQFVTILANNGIGVVCAIAVLWLAWYRETKTLPALMATFAKIQDDVQIQFNDRNSKSLDTFSILVREERQIYQRWHEENLRRLEKLLDEGKDQRHLVRNLAHQLGLQQAVQQELDRERTPVPSDSGITKKRETGK